MKTLFAILLAAGAMQSAPALAEPSSAKASAPSPLLGSWAVDISRLPIPQATADTYHLSTLFPPVRPRGGYLEVRYLDTQPPERIATAVTTLAVLLLDPTARRAGRTPGPYLMAATFLVVLASHLWWLVDADFPPFRYIEARAVS